MLKFVRSFWFSWVLVTSLSSALGLTAGAFLIVLLRGDDSLPFKLGLLVISGLFIGYGQWILLRTKSMKASGWIFATAIGLSLGFLFGYVLLTFNPHLFMSGWAEISIVAIFAGTITGILQWCAVHGRLTGSAMWLIASVLGWGIALHLGIFLFALFLSRLDLWFLFTPLLGLVVGAVIGITSGAFVETSIIRTSQNAS
jgi:hypothetical protein